jgi:IclR family acetate operon transcriptional repressor
MLHGTGVAGNATSCGADPVRAARPELLGSVMKAVAILDCLAGAQEELGIRDLAQRVGLPKSTTFRLVQTLERARLLSQDGRTQRYSLGERTLEFGMAYLRRADVRTVSLPVMRRLREATGETVGLSVRTGFTRTYIEQLESPHQLRTQVELGRPFPLHLGAPGKLLLAYMGDDEIVAVLDQVERSSPPGAASQPTSRQEVLERLAEIRRRGHSLAFGETIEGLTTIAAPIRNVEGSVVAALSVSGPTSRFSEPAREQARTLLIDAARQISQHLGFDPGRRPPAPADPTGPGMIRSSHRPAAQ